MIAAKQHCIAIGSTKYYIYDWNFTNGMEIKEQITGMGQQYKCRQRKMDGAGEIVGNQMYIYY